MGLRLLFCFGPAGTLKLAQRIVAFTPTDKIGALSGVPAGLEETERYHKPREGCGRPIALRDTPKLHWSKFV